MTYQFDFSVVSDNWPLLLQGVLLTLQISVVSMALALVVAIVMVIAKGSANPVFRWGATTFVEVVRNTPFLIQIFFVFFGLPQLGFHITPYAAAVIALAFNGGAYCTEIIRGGVQSIRKGQIDAGVALGLGRLQVFYYVLLRPALRSVYPALTSQFILIMLTSSVASTISTLELTLVGMRIESQTFRSFEIFGAITLIYLALALVLSGVLGRIGRIFFSYPVK